MDELKKEEWGKEREGKEGEHLHGLGGWKKRPFMVNILACIPHSSTRSNFICHGCMHILKGYMGNLG